MSADRFKRLWTRDLASASLVVLALAMGANEAAAQAQPMPPEHYTLDPRGVDLVSGGFNHSTTDVVIGPGGGGLVHARQYLEGWRDVEVGGLTGSGSEIVVATGSVSETFVPDGSGGWKPKYDNGSTYEVLSDGTVKVTDRDGDVALFAEPEGGWGLTNYVYTAPVTSERSPDGTETTYHWKSACRDGGGLPWCLNDVKQTRLQAITNNRGYQLKFFYASNATDPSMDWMRITKVVGLNMAVDYCDPMADTCPTFTENWPSMTYSYVGPLLQVNPAPASTTDQSGRTTAYTYDNFRISSIRYPDATADDVAVTYNASPDFRVNGVTDASGAWTYGYSTSGTTQTTVASGPLNQQLTVVANLTTGLATSVTQVTSVSPTVDRTWAYQYDSDLRVTRITQPEGDYVAYAYDGRGNPTQTTYVSKTGPGSTDIVTSTTYPTTCSNPVTCNLPTTTTDALGSVTDYVWDSTHGGLLSVTAPAPTTGATRPQTRYAYGDFHARYHDSASTYLNGPAITLPIEVSACATGASCNNAANEVLTTIDYPTTGAPNNLLPVSTSRGSGATPLMATTTMTYTSDGDVATVDGPLAGTADTVTYVHDVARLVIGVIGPDPDGADPLLNRAQRLTYNDRGQVTLAETGTASGGVWSNFSALLKSQTTYDTAAYFRPIETRQMSAAGAVSGVQQINYDAAGRPSCTVVRMNPSTFSSLPSSACTAATTGDIGPDRIAQTAYDAAGRAVSITAGGVTESVAYTTNGGTASLTDGAGNISIMEYDGFDRMTKLRYPNPTGGGTSTTDYEAWTWNDAGQPLTSRNRAAQTTTLTWDLLGRLINVNAPSGTMDVATTYDNLGRALTTTGNSQTLTNVWDALSRLTSETGPLGAMAWEYDPAGRMTKITWPDAFYVKYSHDLYGAVASVAENGATSGAGVLAEYTYDNLGQLIGIARADGAGAATTYAYDAFGRLDSLVQNPSGTTHDLTLGFSYNPANQIVGREVSNTDYLLIPTTGTTDYENNGLNQVTEIDSAAVSYDGDKNATAVDGNTYGYDAAGRLTSANAGMGAATFVFDPAGRLYQTSVGGLPTRFQYVGTQLVAEYDGSGDIVARHIPGLGLNDIAASWDLSSTSPVRLWPLADERGSVIASSGSTGAASQINRYDEYGVPASGNAGRFQYTGQAWLVEADASHYRARTYLPQIGRFLQSDPIGYAPSLNVYAYANGDPINFVDPLGLTPRAGGYQDCWWAGSGPRGSTPVKCRPPVYGTSNENLFGIGNLDRVSLAYSGITGRFADVGTSQLGGIDRGRVPQCLVGFVERHIGVDMSSVYVLSGVRGGSGSFKDTIMLRPEAYNDIWAYIQHFLHEVWHTNQYAEGRLTYFGAIRELHSSGYEDAWFENEAEAAEMRLMELYNSERPCGNLGVRPVYTPRYGQGD
jgi:RHS repeat-associated protein